MSCSERVLVLSYTKPELPRCTPERRERWLAELHPGAERLVLDDARLAELCAVRGIAPRSMPPDAAPDDAHRDFVAWLCLELLGTTVDAVFTSEQYGDGFARRLSMHFDRPVRHVCVDPLRENVQASGRALRDDPFAHRHLLDPRVYADLVGRVALLGGESSGKTTLAAALAEALQTSWVPEYGRELWTARAGRLRRGDMVEIARTQVAREQALAAAARDWLFCDTSPLTTLFYSRALFGQSDPELEQLAARPYDLIVLCEPDFGFVDDGTRQGPAFSLAQHRWYVDELERRGALHLRAVGTVAQRVQMVAEALHRS